MKSWMLFGTLCGLGLIACGGGADEGDGSGGSGATSANGPSAGAGAGTAGSGGSPTGTGSGTGSGAGGDGSTSAGSGGGAPTACGQMATWEACEICECDNNPQGCESFWSLEDEHCYCGASAPCAASCVEYCNNDDWNTSCSTCDDGLDDTCFEAAEAACDMDGACSSYATALWSNCENLPDP